MQPWVEQAQFKLRGAIRQASSKVAKLLKASKTALGSAVAGSV
jgi:hypothetical protein